MDPQGNEWNLLSLKIMKTTLRAKGLLRWPKKIWCTSLFPCPKRWTILHAKAAVEKGWKKLETIPAWQLGKVKSKKEVILEAQRDKNIVHFATLMDMCHLNNAELEKITKRKKTKAESCSEDGSGANAGFTEQGSSASQMTAAKIRVVIARLPGCDGQAADAVSAYTRENWRTLPDCSKYRSQNVQTYGYVFHDINGQTPAQTLKILWCFLNEICTDTHLLGNCGKDSSRKFCWSLDEKKDQIGNVCLFIENKYYFCQKLWMTSKWLERSRIWLPCGRNWKKRKVDLDEPTSFLDHVNWDALNVNANLMK